MLMSTKITALLFLVAFFLSIIFCLYFGIYLAQRQEQKIIHKNYGLQVVEGSVFALLGLIVAFTFSSASQRFDAGRYLITQQANAIRSAYFLIDLISPELQNNLRQDFKQYLSSEIAADRKSSDRKAYALEHNRSQEIQKKIWQQAIKECISKELQYRCPIFLSALNNMFDIANTRYSNADIHPPWAIFVFLVGLAMLGALLAGYDIGDRGKGRNLYLFSYAIVIALTVYIVIDLEFPRLGFIRIDSFDKVLIQLYELIAGTAPNTTP